MFANPVIGNCFTYQIQRAIFFPWISVCILQQF